jgi:hypothetical protein
MKLLKTFLIFFIVFGVAYFFTGFSYADFNFKNWKESSRHGILCISLFITYSIFYFRYILD